MSDRHNDVFHPWQPWMRMWTETASKVMGAGQPAAAETPPEMARRMRSAWLDAYSQIFESYFRSPEFLEMMRQSLTANNLKHPTPSRIPRVLHSEAEEPEPSVLFAPGVGVCCVVHRNRNPAPRASTTQVCSLFPVASTAFRREGGLEFAKTTWRFVGDSVGVPQENRPIRQPVADRFLLRAVARHGGAQDAQ